MAFDFKKEYREFYMPEGAPEIVNVPRANYIAVRGKGDPNEVDGAVSAGNRRFVRRGVHAENELQDGSPHRRLF